MNVALIPVRGGSKSIPMKNVREIAGKPLVYWTVRAASECNDIDRVYIATDSIQIKEVVESFKFDKVNVIERGADTATDTAATESVMLEFAENYDFDTITLIQATSPLLTSADLTGGFYEFYRPGTDSVLSVVRQKRFQWELNQNGFAKSVNYNMFCRPRRQEFDGFLVENGAFYITRRQMLLESENRLSGNIRVYEMDASTYLEVDEPDDWIIIEKLLMDRCRQEKMRKTDISRVKLFLTDCDGCLTDGGMYYSEYGDEAKRFNTKDAMGFRLLKERGILTGVITGEDVLLNKRRAEKMQLDFYEAGCEDKYEKVCEICRNNCIAIDEVVYVGDDINDLETVKNVGLGCSVANGIESVKSAAVYVSTLGGGNGAVREIIDWILDRYGNEC